MHLYKNSELGQLHNCKDSSPFPNKLPGEFSTSPLRDEKTEFQLFVNASGEAAVEWKQEVD